MHADGHVHGGIVTVDEAGRMIVGCKGSMTVTANMKRNGWLCTRVVAVAAVAGGTQRRDTCTDPQRSVFAALLPA